MAENRVNDEREAELRVKLVKRLAVAGVMVAVLLAVLAFFDYLAKPEELDAPVFTRPVPVPPKKEITQPVKPNAELPEPPKSEAKPAEPAVPPAPVVPAKPEAAVAPVPEASKPVAKTAPVRPASEKTSEASAKPEATAKITPVHSLPEGTSAPGSKTVESAAVARPEAVAPPSTVARPSSPMVVPAPTLTRLLAGFVVQAGVFANASAAEELHAKLALNGIPSTLEAKVSVGPFKTREEAVAAQLKMKALGIDGLLIPPSGRK